MHVSLSTFPPATANTHRGLLFSTFRFLRIPSVALQLSPAKLWLRDFPINSKLLCMVFFSGKNSSIPKKNVGAVKIMRYFTLLH